MKRPEEAAIVLKNLKALGITVSIDDFDFAHGYYIGMPVEINSIKEIIDN